MQTIAPTVMLAMLIAAVPTFAQTAAQEHSTRVSVPGSATATHTVTGSVLVVGIDRADRSVTLKDAIGREFSVVAGPEVRNFNQIKVNDTVYAEYSRALSLTLTEAEPGKNISDTYIGNRAPAGAPPAGSVARTITAIAEVIAIDEPNKIITLQGPRGRIVELEVSNPDHFRAVKPGARVEVRYTEAVAIALKPGAAAAGK